MYVRGAGLWIRKIGIERIGWDRERQARSEDFEKTWML